MTKNHKEDHAESSDELDDSYFPEGWFGEGGERVKKEDPKKKKPVTQINYSFLDGLRGIGAFCVYLLHWEDYHWFKAGHVESEKFGRHQSPDWLRSITSSPFGTFK